MIQFAFPINTLKTEVYIMKKAFVFALTALIIAMTATGCGNEAKTDSSKSTADEARASTSEPTMPKKSPRRRDLL